MKPSIVLYKPNYYSGTWHIDVFDHTLSYSLKVDAKVFPAGFHVFRNTTSGPRGGKKFCAI
jgi:hypothetical protein